MEQVEHEYEEVEEFVSDPSTEGNVAYGQFQLQSTKRSNQQSYTKGTKEQFDPGPVYGEPEVYVPDPNTVRNTHVATDTPGDNKPDPDTVGNVAYGYVQR